MIGQDPAGDKQRCGSALGFFWEPLPIPLPRENRPDLALFIFKKNMAGIAWNSLGVFEHNPATLPQTETILQGQAVGGISIEHLAQVKRFGDAAAFLVDSIQKAAFRLDLDFARRLHAIVGKEEALEWGVLRNRPVHIRGVSHVPPPENELPALAEKGLRFLGEYVESPVERAIAVFLFMSRTQFFFDCNKRSAALMMNGVLLSAGYYPITVLRETTEEFNEKLRAFYDSGEATEMFAYFAGLCATLYST